MIKHSKIGASSAKRWMACPGSVRLCENTVRRASEYADEGTAAHALAEMCIRNKELTSDAHIGEIVEGQPVTENMAEAVNVYLQSHYLDSQPGDEIDIEVRFSLNEIHTGLFGTADRVRYRPSDQSLRITDYKHGAGVPVEVEDNPQLLYYGVGGALGLHNRGIRVLQLEIVQPRCPHPGGPVRLWEISIVDLVEFAEELRQAALATEDPNAPLHPGEHCRWCPAAGFCPELSKRALQLATHEFGPALHYEPGELSEALENVSMVEQWVKSVKEFAYSEAQAGRIAPGFKLVEKRATRKFRDDWKAIQELRKFGLAEEQIFDPATLKSVAQIEKAYGKKNMKALEDLIVAESSGTTLAPLTDRRPAVAKATANEEFTALDEANVG